MLPLHPRFLVSFNLALPFPRDFGCASLRFHRAFRPPADAGGKTNGASGTAAVGGADVAIEQLVRNLMMTTTKEIIESTAAAVSEKTAAAVSEKMAEAIRKEMAARASPPAFLFSPATLGALTIQTLAEVGETSQDLSIYSGAPARSVG
jgi:hypothetical protein